MQTLKVMPIHSDHPAAAQGYTWGVFEGRYLVAGYYHESDARTALRAQRSSPRHVRPARDFFAVA